MEKLRCYIASNIFMRLNVPLFVAVDAGEAAGLRLGGRGSLGQALLQGLLAPGPPPRHHLYTPSNNTGQYCFLYHRFTPKDFPLQSINWTFVNAFLICRLINHVAQDKSSTSSQLQSLSHLFRQDLGYYFNSSTKSVVHSQ